MPLRRPFAVSAILALALGAAGAASAADDPSAPVVPTVTGETTTNVRVRFGPSADPGVGVATTLAAGKPVEVIGKAEANPDWLVIRFPREGRAWVHAKNLQAAGEGRWRVVGRGANVRDDARLSGSNVIAQLSPGEILEDKGQRVGDFIAVYPPNAVAYIAAKYVRLPDAVDTARMTQENQARRQQADKVWAVAQSTYSDFRNAAQARPESALSKDWEGLKRQLDEVVANHPDVQARVAAGTIRESVAKLVAAAEAYAKAKGTEVKPEASVPQPGTGSAGTGAAVASAQTQTAVAALPQIVPAAPAYAAEGLVVQQEFPKLSVTYVVMNSDGKVVAFLKTKDGAIQLSEYIYRYVGVKGATEAVPADQHDLGRDVPLVMADEVVLLNR